MAAILDAGATQPRQLMNSVNAPIADSAVSYALAGVYVAERRQAARMSFGLLRQWFGTSVPILDLR